LAEQFAVDRQNLNVFDDVTDGCTYNETMEDNYACFGSQILFMSSGRAADVHQIYTNFYMQHDLICPS